MTLAPGVRADLLAAIRLVGSLPTGVRASRERYAGAEPVALRGRPLEQFLYTEWFACAGRAGEAGGSLSPVDDDDRRPSLTARLRAAHTATAQLESGWYARRVGRDGTLLAARADELVEVTPPDYVNLDRPAAPVRVGDAVAVTARRDGTDTGGAWWITSGIAGAASTAAMVRVYWNCPPETAAPLVAGLTHELEAIGLPYTLKCPTAEVLFDRVEPVVLYLGVADWLAARGALRGVHAALVGRLRSRVPPLTLRLGPGAAAAEDPADGRSFGQSRAAAVADGLAHANEQRLTDEAAILSVVVSRLSAHGISPICPYVRKGSPPDLVTGW